MAEEKAKTLSKILFEQFLQHKMATWSAVFLIFMASIAAFAPLITSVLGVDPEIQNVLHRYEPMGAKVEISRDQKESLMTRILSKQPELGDRLIQKAASQNLLPIDVQKSEVPYELLKFLEDDQKFSQLQQLNDPDFNTVLELKEDFVKTHWLGTDELGRDALARLIYGARVSLLVAAITALASAFIGLLVGCLAGFYGGILDTVLMRITDAFLALPITPLLIVLAAVDLKKIPIFDWILTSFPPESESMAKMVIVLGLFGWMSIARLVRGSVLSVKESEYVMAAKTLGATDATIIFKHIIPNVMAPLLVSVTLGVGSSMIAESGLSFLGLGIQPPMPSWGNMLQNAMELVTSSTFLAIAPGLMIFFVSVAVNFVGDGLRDAIDPKAIRR